MRALLGAGPAGHLLAAMVCFVTVLGLVLAATRARSAPIRAHHDRAERGAAVLNRIERARKQSIQALRTVFNTYCSKAACGQRLSSSVLSGL